MDINEIFLNACKNGQKGVIQAFLKNENVPINSINDEGNTPLVIACIRGNTLIANILLEANALIVDNYKKSALSYASERGFTEITEMLIPLSF